MTVAMPLKPGGSSWILLSRQTMGQANIQMEPTRLSSRAIMSPRRAAHLAR